MNNKRFNEHFFGSIDSEIKAYWLGFLMADGCVSITQSPSVIINLNKRDRDHLAKWNAALNANNKIHHKKRDVVSTRHYSKTMCDDLIKYGCTPKKSLTLLFPNIDHYLERHWLRGYIDGDGCIYQNPKTQNIKIQIIGTESVLNGIQKICDTNVKLQKPSKAYSLCIHGNRRCKKILDWIYKDATIYLDRKEVYYSNLCL